MLDFDVRTSSEAVLRLILDGMTVEYGRLSICPIKKQCKNFYEDHEFQVWCDTSDKQDYCEWFIDPIDAVADFMRLKRKIDNESGS